MGYGRVRSLTAVGDTVNVASRLEHAAKEFDAAIVISEPVAELAGASGFVIVRRGEGRFQFGPLELHSGGNGVQPLVNEVEVRFAGIELLHFIDIELDATGREVVFISPLQPQFCV